ncbi:hypothetical protein O181_029514 [Austropuccinia psidii MF-1]|uniref:Uncharacterized protein n=1 Tax=Austropuccinia psidii MF-1 TaxID=1389203 RepID=A0A9Q3CSF7_9BASI|nr:hypothetical protein [Austropuccinia psidii MF-1]
MHTRRWNSLLKLPLPSKRHKTDIFAIIDFKVKNVLNNNDWHKLEKNEMKKKKGIWPYLQERSRFDGIDFERPSESVQRIEKCSQSGQGDAYNNIWVEYPLEGACQERDLVS